MIPPAPHDAASGPARPALPGSADLPKPRRKLLASLGHQIARFGAACEKFRAKAPPFPELAPWLAIAAGQGRCDLGGDGIFACAVGFDETRVAVHPLVVSPSATAATAAALGLDPAPPLDAASLRAPLWSALLRLRPLHDFWERELRRATFDLLLELLPDAWLLDPTPLPPGAVIPRLELASWDAFDPGETSFTPATRDDVRAALARHPDRPEVLIQYPALAPGATRLLSVYRKNGDRVDWLGTTPAA